MAIGTRAPLSYNGAQIAFRVGALLPSFLVSADGVIVLPMPNLRHLRPLCAAAILIGLAAPQLARAQVEPLVKTGPGFVVIAFTAPEGSITAYLPDDVAGGETFSGTLEGPRGFVLKFGDQRGNAGGRFHWKMPPGPTPRRLSLVLVDPKGRASAPAVFPIGAVEAPEPLYHCPKLIQAGRPFPVRGPFDGDSGTTSVMVGGRSTVPLVESRRKAVVQAPADILGPAACTITKSRRTYRSEVRSVSIDMDAPVDDAPRAARTLTIKGLAGIDQDVPFQIADNYFYLRSAEVAPDGTFSVRREFPGGQNGSAVALVIPQSRREEVAVILRTPQRERDTALATQHGEALRSLDFDAFPVARELFADFRLDTDAADALLAADERRALAMIFESIPKSGLNLTRLGFSWFLSHPSSILNTAREAHDAALRVLARVESTSNAELALRVVGLTGSDADLPLLEWFFQKGGSGVGDLRDASEAALIRLGSRQHLERLLAELAPPLTSDATYTQALQLAQVLRKARLAGRSELVPSVCAHISDPVIIEIDIRVDGARVAASTLSAIVEGILPPGAPRRSLEDWKSYCR